MTANAARGNDERVLLDAGGPSLFVRGVTLICIVLGLILIACSYWAVTSLTKVDGTLEPLGARLTLGALILVTGLLLSLGLWVYIQLYVLRLVRRGSMVEVTTSRIFYNHTALFERSDFETHRDHQEGSFLIVWFFSNTPFDSLKVGRNLLPYILDRKIEHFDSTAIASLTRR